MTTAYCYDERFLKHDYPGHPENAGRLEAIMTGLQNSSLWDRLVQTQVVAATDEEIARVHSVSYIEQVRRIADRGGGHLDPDTYVTRDSYDTALLAAGGLMALTRSVLDGQVSNGFGLVRPPGHHATPTRGMGFCLFNNIAVAARDALTSPDIERVMIVDFDVHHGNGTQDIFIADPDVLFFSTHQFPHYPGTGWLNETGTGDAKGSTVNIPLPAGAGDEGFALLMHEIVWPVAKRYHPNLILVSAGFDAHWTDPLAMLSLSLAGYAHIARQLVAMANEICDGRIVFTLEGGYERTVLSNSVINVFYALLGEHAVSDPIGPSPQPETDIQGRIYQVLQEHQISN